MVGQHLEENDDGQDGQEEGREAAASAGVLMARRRTGGSAGGGNFIAGAIKKPGALHADLGVPKGEKIPAAKLEKATHAPGKLGQRARFAQTLKGLRK